MVKSAYIHIPFCKSKCHYCSFVSFNKFELKNDYLKALTKEIDNYYQGEVLNTIYLGGGTPSTFEIPDIERILRRLKFNENTEITIELNPDDVNYDYLRRLFDIGINRLSFGCQTFNDDILKQINRRHNAGQVINAVKLAQDAQFKNISLDFIYGLPNQAPEIFYDDLNIAMKLGIQHISLYGLSIEKGCYFSSHLPKNIPDDDTQADMYLGAVEILTNAGFEHYEISNFSLKGYNSKHNLNYWNNEEYYGFGVSAHGYVNNIRYGNKIILENYIQNPLEHDEEKFVTGQNKLEEEIFLGFRKMSGINIEDIDIKYNIDFLEKYNDVIKKYEGLKLLKKTKGGYAFTLNGILVSNTILAEFID
ncbi:radical SAM family heme chaperone HemW [bacterium]|nr:radical SAM family heme chaperone HemW [bacterium]